VWIYTTIYDYPGFMSVYPVWLQRRDGLVLILGSSFPGSRRRRNAEFEIRRTKSERELILEANPASMNTNALLIRLLESMILVCLRIFSEALRNFGSKISASLQV
jgi:hypothetical protein